jgi:signal peptidase I
MPSIDGSIRINWIVQSGGIFVLGDNPKYSVDSRTYGSVPAENVIGIVYKRWWPLTKSGPIP